MKLSIFLLRDDVTNFQDALLSKYFEGDEAFEAVERLVELPFECAAFVQKNRSTAPKWLAFLGGAFDLAPLDLRNQTNSFVLLLTSNHRKFAVTFGHGVHAIDRTKIEPRFGVMVSANRVNPHAIRTFDTNLVDTITRNRRTHVSTGSDLYEFEVDPRRDFVRRLGGRPTSSEFASSVSGADSVSIGVDCEIANLAEKCEELLEAYTSDEYKQAFRFLDHLQPLSRYDSRLSELNEKLEQKLTDRSYERISIAFQEPPDEERLDHFKITASRRSADLEELSLESVYGFLDEFGVPSNPKSIRVIALDGNDSPISKLHTLSEHLVSEIEHDGETFIYCLGSWFAADTDYVNEVRQEAADVDDLSTSLTLEPIKNGESEGDYNTRVAEDRQWRLMDKDLVQVGGTQQKVEICDLLTKERHLICVKKMEKSSTLSHLFAQGSVSATLLREDSEYLEAVNSVASHEWADFDPIVSNDLNDVTVVYAIATRKDGPLSSNLFFFSLVNLLSHVKAIRRLGCKVAVCKIEYAEDAKKPVKTKRKKKDAVAADA